jgi:hypothetical protein
MNISITLKRDIEESERVMFVTAKVHESYV